MNRAMTKLRANNCRERQARLGCEERSPPESAEDQTRERIYPPLHGARRSNCGAESSVDAGEKRRQLLNACETAKRVRSSGE
jgi:hypothetical protein